VKKALVVRSGERTFPAPPAGTIAIREAISHDIVDLSIGIHELFVPAEWAIFTSGIAVRRVFENASTAEKFRAAIAGGRVVAVGAKTAEALAAAGRGADLIARGSAGSILAVLPADLSNQRVVLPCGEDATGQLPVALTRRGALVERVVLYGKTPRPADPSLGEEIGRGEHFAFCATSPSAARWLLLGLAPGALASLAALPAVTLGASTAAYLARRGAARIETADPPSFEGALARLLALAGSPSAS
jgi:uroporphyrinogen III methyltransferase/synthase